LIVLPTDWYCVLRRDSARAIDSFNEEPKQVLLKYAGTECRVHGDRKGKVTCAVFKGIMHRYLDSASEDL
jgi:hypothetical protein